MSNKNEYYLTNQEYIDVSTLFDAGENTDFDKKWISVSNFLPENEDNVLVTYEIVGRSERYLDISQYLCGSWVSDSDEFLASDVIKRIVAWQPLPTPYKGV